jgi:hypothetical protein
LLPIAEAAIVGRMKLFLFAPVTAHNDDPGAMKAREAEANRLITDLLLRYLSPLTDATLHAVYGDGERLLHIPLQDELTAREWISRSLDPYDPTGCQVRSLVNCRCAVFGFDGQATLCLRFEDDTPTSPNEQIVVVEEVSRWLIETDWIDGFSLE